MADDQKKDPAAQTAPSAAQEAQDKAYNALPEQVAIRLKKNGAIADIALLGGDKIDASAITDAQYLQIANDLIKNRTTEFKTKDINGKDIDVDLSIKDLDTRLEILRKDPATKAEYDKAIKALGTNSFDQAIPDEARRTKIAKAVGDAVEENTGSLPFLGGASFMNALMGFIKWLVSGCDGWIDGLKASITKETASGIAASTENNLAGAGIGLSSDTIKEIAGGVRTRILKEKGVADKDTPEPETLATTKGAEPPKKEAPKETPAVIQEPAKEITPAPEALPSAGARPSSAAPAISPPPPPPIPQTSKPAVVPAAEAGAAVAVTSGAAAAFLKYMEEQKGTPTTQAPAVQTPPAEKPVVPYDPAKPPVLPEYQTLPGKANGDTKQPSVTTPPAEPTPQQSNAGPAKEVKTPAIVKPPVVASKDTPKAYPTQKKAAPKEEPKHDIAAAPAPSSPTPAQPATVATTPAAMAAQPSPAIQAPAPIIQQQPSHLERAITDIADKLLPKDIPNKPEVVSNLSAFLTRNAKDIDFNNPKKGIERVIDKLFSSNDPLAQKIAAPIRDYTHKEQEKSSLNSIANKALAVVGKKTEPVSDATIKMLLGNELRGAIRENKDPLEKAMALDNAAQKAGKEMQNAGVSENGQASFLSAARPQEQQFANR